MKGLRMVPLPMKLWTNASALDKRRYLEAANGAPEAARAAMARDYRPRSAPRRRRPIREPLGPGRGSMEGRF